MKKKRITITTANYFMLVIYEDKFEKKKLKNTIQSTILNCKDILYFIGEIRYCHFCLVDRCVISNPDFERTIFSILSVQRPFLRH